MNDLLENIINEATHPIRADALLEIVKSLSAVGYQEDLNNVVVIAGRHDSSMDAIADIEELIFSCAFNLLNKLGVQCNHDVACARPVYLNHIIDAILFDIEDWDDYDTLLAIMDSGEPNNITIGNMVSFITCDPASNYHDIIEDVQDNTMKVVRGALSVKVIRDDGEESPLDHERIARVVNYLSKYPASPLATLFENYGFMRDPMELAKQITIEYDVNAPEKYAEHLGVAAAGLAILTHSTYKDAYESDLGKYVRVLLDDDHVRYLITGSRVAKNILQSLYPDAEKADE